MKKISACSRNEGNMGGAANTTGECDKWEQMQEVRTK